VHPFRAAQFRCAQAGKERIHRIGPLGLPPSLGGRGSLARHYGFTAEELDFILNYDIKYRMGDALGGDDE
jgi:hypothetical protein